MCAVAGLAGFKSSDSQLWSGDVGVCVHQHPPQRDSALKPGQLACGMSSSTIYIPTSPSPRTPSRSGTFSCVFSPVHHPSHSDASAQLPAEQMASSSHSRASFMGGHTAPLPSARIPFRQNPKNPHRRSYARHL